MAYPDNDRAAISRLRAVGESIDVRIDDPTLIGVQGNTLGIRSETALWSTRTDSRTYFLQDQDFGPDRPRGHFGGSPDVLLDAMQSLLDRLGIAQDERATKRVVTERTRAASYDPETNHVELEPVQDGIRYAEVTRAIEGIPIWHSKALLALAADGRPGFIQVHWPELPDDLTREAAAFADAITAGWKPPDIEAAHPETSEAGVLHSLAVGFVMEAVAVVRVIYAADDPGIGRKPVRYVTIDGQDVPEPRNHLWHLDEVVMSRRPAQEAG
jgi:hypothetical protein